MFPFVPLLVITLAGQTSAKLGSDDSEYLRALARDTWHCIESLAHPETGLPFDNASKGEFTSVSNIGIYLTSLCAAKEMGLAPAAEAERRAAKGLASLEKLKTWHGFAQCWNSVENLQPAKHDPWISLLDTGNYAAGLIVSGQTFPSLRKRFDALFDAMDWSWFYDRSQRALIGGYDTSKSEFNAKWHLAVLGTDAELAQFFAIARGAAPPAFWEALDRSTESRYGQTYLKPGWQGGGLFMQFISGLWLENRGTFIGRSSKAFAAAQIAHAKSIGFPVWGWSASDNPAGGYLGWGALKDEVVTPHASVLAIEHFPSEVVANLHALEKLGVRTPKDGFLDSVNVKTGEKSKQFLMLDQGMLFLSLANYLQKDWVRKQFQAHPIVQKGRRLIAEFREAG